ncbi:hypothetical protein CGJ53_16120 [Vibrio parahaemolyticus]|nr:hypothetical protein CGJ53_16120 [Vibrio parahaemolyticus]
MSLNLISLANRVLVSANQYVLLKFLNHSNRKTCQNSGSCLIENRICARKVFSRKVWKGQVYEKPVFAETLAR